MLVYVIQSGTGIFGLENRHATLDKEIAKKLIKKEILSRERNKIYGDYIDEFAQDLVDGNNEYHYGDDFHGITIWCDILELQEKKETES